MTSEELLGLFVGKIVVVRGRDAGVHLGTLVGAACHEGVSLAALKDSRRLWHWTADEEDSAKSFTLSGIALHGVPSGSRMAEMIEDVIIVAGWCELLPLKPEAISTMK